MNKYLMYGRSNLGRLGEFTGTRVNEDCNGYDRKVELFVGDVIAFVKYGRAYTSVVSKKSLGAGDKYGVFGFGSDNFDFKNITKILDYQDLTEDMFQKLQEPDGRNRDNFKIIEQDYREMTVEEVERALGYKVKIKS